MFNKTLTNIRSMMQPGYRIQFAYDRYQEPDSTDDETWQIYDSQDQLKHTVYVNDGVIDDCVDH